MSRVRLHCPRLMYVGVLAALLYSPAPTHACSKPGFVGVRYRHEAHFIGIPGSDSMLAGAGMVKYVVAPGHFGPQGDRAVYGQVVRIERIGGLAARRLRRDVAEVVVVPWDYGADCTPVPWTRSSIWLAPNERGLITATLRDSAYWANSLPTFDVHTPNLQPYPQRAPQQMRQRRVRPDTLLSIDDLFLLMEVLPEERALADSAEQAVAPLFQWTRSHPELARRYPATVALSRARYAVTSARVQRITSPLTGTYRFSFRLGDGPMRSFHARSQLLPSGHWSNSLEPLPQSDDPTLVPRPPGYYLKVTAARNASEVPDRCDPNPDPRQYRDGYIAVLDQPPVATPAGLQWSGKLELDLLRRVFADDAALSQFVSDEFDRSFRRLQRGIARTADLPARFTQTRSGAVRVEQAIALDDGRRIEISGERISSATISCTPDDPAATVQRLYRDYAWEVLWWPAPRHWRTLIDEPREVLSNYFDDRLTDLIVRDRECVARSGGECHIGASPIWASNDPEADELEVVVTKDPTLVQATFKRRYPPPAGTRVTLLFRMIRTSKGWRIADIMDGNASLVARLQGQ